MHLGVGVGVCVCVCVCYQMYPGDVCTSLIIIRIFLFFFLVVVFLASRLPAQFECEGRAEGRFESGSEEQVCKLNLGRFYPPPHP